jgi:hypothetical protein
MLNSAACLFLVLVSWGTLPGRAISSPVRPPQEAESPQEKVGIAVESVEKSDLPQLKKICRKTAGFQGGALNSCYRTDWNDWVRFEKEEIVPIAERKSFMEFLERGSLLEDVSQSRLIFPDKSVHFVWKTVGKFSDDVVYWLADAKKKQLDIVWISDSRPKYLGPNAELLRKYEIASWLADYSDL